MATENTLLQRLLSTLVQEWGLKEVEAALARLAAATSEDDALTFEDGVTVRRPPKKDARRIAAIELVARARPPETQEPALRELAMRFDRKQFLPSAADVREFLLMVGQSPREIKDRATAFRVVLKALSGLRPEELDRVVKSELYSGPSRLGPLSEAISNAAATLPRQRETTDG